MAVHHATARKLATKAEWSLLQASRGRELTALSPARLRQKVARSRKFSDKYRAMARQQRGEARGKRSPKSVRAAQGNANTLVKQQMFAEALERFEGRLTYLEQKAEREAIRTAKATRAKARKGGEQRKVATAAPPQAAGTPWLATEAATATAREAHSADSRGARKQQKLLHQSALAHQGHVGSRGRHNQARRDGR